MGRSAVASPHTNYSDSSDETRALITRAFSPTVAIYASSDTNELVSRKGFKNGFRELIRPYGERVSGKVVVRDSGGASRAWDDFGVRFVDLAELADVAVNQDFEYNTSLARLDEMLERYLDLPVPNSEADQSSLQQRDVPGQTSPYLNLFLNRLLSSSTFTTHETFLHPVACVIAIGSGLPNPIETLRQLYAQTAQGNKTLPAFVNPEYLRYYVLVHDEDEDDITKSLALFDQMKRHFGLHCHLLRLRSSECMANNDDAAEFPACEWLSPSEDLAKLRDTGLFMSAYEIRSY